MRVRLPAFRFPEFGLPLLSKELIEQAARRRTYIVRVGYACLLFLGSYLLFFSTLNPTGANAAALGHGREIFDAVVMLQFAGIYLFMPALTCGVLTLEKERNTLGLVFLTRLGPWTILFEKLLSRLVPMFSFLLLSLPLLAFAYSLGGVSEGFLWSAVWVLALTAFQVGTLALFCSAYCRTTVAAFMATYLFGVALFAALPLYHAWLIYYAGLTGPIVSYHLFGPLALFDPPFSQLFFGASPTPPYSVEVAEFMGVAVGSIPMLLSGFVCMLLARMYIVRHAFLQPRNRVLKLFQRLDGLLQQLNRNRVTRGVVLLNESTSLPADKPVAWRETTRKSLGTTRYLVRVLVTLEIPVAACCTLVAVYSVVSDRLMTGLSIMVCGLWLLSILMVAVKAASLIAGERSQQTLDVLLATPLSGREIVEQKYRGVRRLIHVLSIPFWTVFGFEVYCKDGVYLHGGSFPSDQFNPYLYLTCSLLSVAIYLPMVAWLSLYFGLRMRTPTLATLGALAAVVGWCVLPLVLVFLPLEIAVGGISMWSWWALLIFISPAAIVPLNEFGDNDWVHNAPWFCVIVNYALYGFCLWRLRSLCLKNADEYLGRCPPPWWSNVSPIIPLEKLLLAGLNKAQAAPARVERRGTNQTQDDLDGESHLGTLPD